MKAIVGTLRAKIPAAKILLLGVFPRDEKPDGPMRQQVAAGLLNLHEVKDDEIGAGVDKHLGGEGEVFGLAVTPGAAVDVDQHRARSGARDIRNRPLPAVGRGGLRHRGFEINSLFVDG